MQADEDAVTGSGASGGFFASLPVLERESEVFDPSRYQPAPDDWALAVTDIVGSTAAIAEGRHKTVNFVAAMAIAALKNLCAPEPIPFLFGGDGAVVMVPPGRADAARRELARVRGLAAREFGLQLRVGIAPVGRLRRLGSDVRVGRYEPSPGNHFGVFLGGGVGLLEAAVRGRGEASLIEAAAVPEALDDGIGPELSGLSCRWDELRSRHGKMVTVILQGAEDPRAIHTAVTRLAAPEGDARPVRLDALATRWPPKGLMLEARARRRGGSLALAVARVLVDSIIGWALFASGRGAGGFDPARYRREIVGNTDFCKHDETLCFVVDCAEEAVGSIREHLERCAAAQPMRYGLHVSDTALMTCLVTSASQSLHVHFVDGGAGGYTSAAAQLKAMALGRPARGGA